MSKFWIQLMLLVLLAGAAAAFVVAYRVAWPYQGYTAGEQVVRIAPGRDTASVARRLAGAGVVRDRWTFRIAWWLYGRGREPRSGEYRFQGPLKTRTVVGLLAQGGAPVRLLRVPPGQTLREVAALYETHGLGSAREFLAAARDISLIRDVDRHARDLEGYLFPDIYALPSGRTAAQALVTDMVDRFREVGHQSVRHDAGSSLGLREVVTLASIIERETQSAAERALVAAVYHNRLTRGMILQADPTVIYALARAGSYKGRLSRQDLRFDSAYNTYRYAGLPPGPIGSPGLAALEAAINPAAVDFLFFVSRNDGTHAFSRTPEEHNDNVYRFQVLPFRDKPRPGKTANPRARPADAGEASGGSGH